MARVLDITKAAFYRVQYVSDVAFCRGPVFYKMTSPISRYGWACPGRIFMPKSADGAFFDAICLDRESSALLHVQIEENVLMCRCCQTDANQSLEGR